jgi:ribonuclease BN (tRNA processing enzyme)
VSEVVFIGTSDAFGAGGRRQSAIFVRAGSGGALLDCGATTNSGLATVGIHRDEIDAILISHFHGDHFGGIPLLLLAALYEDKRRKPLWIAGPPEVETRVRGLAHAMGHGIESRDWPFEIHFVELPQGREVDLGPVRARSFEAVHVPDSNPHGLRLDAGDLKVAYTGDTAWFDELPRRVAGADLLISECTYHTSNADFEYHLNYEELSDRRKEFDCGRLILTHLGVEMAHRRGACEIETADDGLVVKL